MVRQRVRIRFSKKGDLRLISHRDLVRVFERLFRRAGVALAMSQGFHPHPQMSFPSALALGVEGCEEVADIVLAEEADPEGLKRRLTAAAPPGLDFLDLRLLDPSEPKAKVSRVHYEVPVPAARHAAVQTAMEDLQTRETLCVERKGKQTCFDLRESLSALSLTAGKLRISLSISSDVQLRPGDILQVLRLDDLPSQGIWLSRTGVELAS